jgi:ATP-dependent protease HslVU (ClpYQ) peptidase subunit
MTCIVAIEHNEKVYMGGDSAAVYNRDIRIIDSKKVFKVGPFLIGYTDSFRMGQLLQYNLVVEKQECTQVEDDEEYLIKVFIPAVRKCLKDGGYAEINNNVESGGKFLVGYKGKIYVVESDFLLLRFKEEYSAIGCGDKYALGCLAANFYREDEPELRIEQSLEVAGQFSNGVAPPYYVEKED